MSKTNSQKSNWKIKKHYKTKLKRVIKDSSSNNRQWKIALPRFRSNSKKLMKLETDHNNYKTLQMIEMQKY